MLGMTLTQPVGFGGSSSHIPVVETKLGLINVMAIRILLSNQSNLLYLLFREKVWLNAYAHLPFPSHNHVVCPF